MQKHWLPSLFLKGIVRQHLLSSLAFRGIARQHWLVLVLFMGMALAQSNPLNELFKGQQDTIGGALGHLFSNTPAPAQTNPNSLVYRPNPSVSAKVQKSFADVLVKAGNLSGDKEKQFRQTITQNLTPANLEQLVSQLFPEEKFKINNLSDATAMFLIACFGVVQDLGQTTPKQDLAVRDQLRAAYLKTPAVLKLQDEQKQTIAETMLYFMVFMLNDYVQAKENKPGYTLEGVQAYAKNVLSGLGLEVSAIQLGQKGLELKNNTRTADKPAAPTNSLPKLGLPTGAKVGGPLEFGRYDCIALKSKRWPDLKNMRYTLGLYPSFEYYIDLPDRPVLEDEGDFSYNASGGTLNISILHDLSTGGDDRQAVFYRDSAGKPGIVAYDDFQTRCQYVGKNSEASLNDKPQYRYSTAPGKGIQLAQIEGIAHSYENIYTVNGLQPEENIYLLLKDGSVMHNPAAPPEDIDLAASKKNDPKAWGVWKREGSKLLVKLADETKWSTTSATMTAIAKPGERLNQTYKASWSYSTGPGLGGTSSFTYYSFKADGSYTRSGYSIGGTGTMQANNGFSSSTSSSTGPDGSKSTTTFSSTGPTSQANNLGPDVVGNSSSQKNDGDNFIGSYSLSGYTLTLKTKSGKIRRHLFFFWSEKRELLNIGNTSYSLEK